MLYIYLETGLDDEKLKIPEKNYEVTYKIQLKHPKGEVWIIELHEYVLYSPDQSRRKRDNHTKIIMEGKLHPGYNSSYTDKPNDEFNVPSLSSDMETEPCKPVASRNIIHGDDIHIFRNRKGVLRIFAKLLLFLSRLVWTNERICEHFIEIFNYWKGGITTDDPRPPQIRLSRPNKWIRSLCFVRTML
uniref:Uncharacterized protein n=1 Tax=Glossina brevipalpis TaxID=37001 RepID=A0A1A9WWR1_9MUSC